MNISSTNRNPLKTIPSFLKQNESSSDAEEDNNPRLNSIPANKNAEENQSIKNSSKKKILLKLSGEILSGNSGFGYDMPTIHHITKQIKEVVDAGHKISIVVGGGNICRGSTMSDAGMSRTPADHMGMLATVINAIMLQNVLEKLSLEVRIMSAIDINDVCEPFIFKRALKHLSKDRVIIFAAGIGNPFFSTDTAAVLRATELQYDELIKGTKVDGIYDKDPLKFKDAIKYKSIHYQDILSKGLKVMDMAAVALAEENKLRIKVFSILRDSLMDVINETAPFSLVN